MKSLVGTSSDSLCTYLYLCIRHGKGIRRHFDGLRSSLEGAVDGEGKLDVQGEERDGGEEGGGEEEAKKSGGGFNRLQLFNVDMLKTNCKHCNLSTASIGSLGAWCGLVYQINWNDKRRQVEILHQVE